MTDLREYKTVVNEALKDLRENDDNWGWSLKRIGKKKIVIRWGYIPDVNISVRVEEEDGDIMLCGRMDDRYPVSIHDEEADDLFILIGDKHWHDASSVDRGLRLLINNIGYIARTRY